MNATEARQRIDRFTAKFGVEYLRFACCAALPVALTPELLHLIRLNFFAGTDTDATSLSYTAEADLLTASGLCSEVNEGLYTLEPDLRTELLRRLPRVCGKERAEELSWFLTQYTERSLSWAGQNGAQRSAYPALIAAQRFTALSVIEPTRALQWLEERQGRGGQTVGQAAWDVAMYQELSEQNNTEDKYVERARTRRVALEAQAEEEFAKRVLVVPNLSPAAVALAPGPLRVFLSGNFSLIAEREAINTELRARSEVTLTGWEAGNNTRTELDERLRHKTNVFVCILDAIGGISGGVEHEYRIAREVTDNRPAPLPCLIYFKTQGERPDGYDHEVSAFKDELRRDHQVQEYSTANELAQRVAHDLRAAQARHSLPITLPPSYETLLALLDVEALEQVLPVLAYFNEGYQHHDIGDALIHALRETWDVANSPAERLVTVWNALNDAYPEVFRAGQGAIQDERHFTGAALGARTLLESRDSILQYPRIATTWFDAQTKTQEWLLMMRLPSAPRVRLKQDDNVIFRLAWSPDGRWLAVPTVTGKVFLWREEAWRNASVGAELSQDDAFLVLHESSHGINQVAWSADGKYLAAVGFDHLCRVWRVQDRKEGWQSERLQRGSDVRTVAWASEGRTMAVGTAYGNIHFYHRVERRWERRNWHKTGQPVNVLAYRSLGTSEVSPRLAFGAENGLLGVLREGDSSYQAIPLGGHNVTSLAWSPTGELVAGTNDGSLFRVIWSNGNKNAPVTRHFNGHQGTVTALSFSADGRLLASKGMSGPVRFWSTTTWEEVGSYPETASNFTLSGLAFHPRDAGLLALSSQADTNVLLLTDPAWVPNGGQETTSSSRPLEGLRLLWIEDTPHRNQQAIQRALNEQGASVTYYTATEMPSDALLPDKSDLVLADYSSYTSVMASDSSSATGDSKILPFGIRLLHQMRQVANQVPVLLLTKASKEKYTFLEIEGIAGMASDATELYTLLTTFWEQTPRGPFYTETAIRAYVRAIERNVNPQSKGEVYGCLLLGIIISESSQSSPSDRPSRRWLCTTVERLYVVADTMIDGTRKQLSSSISILLRDAYPVDAMRLQPATNLPLLVLGIGPLELFYESELHPDPTRLEWQVRKLILDSKRRNLEPFQRELLLLAEEYDSLHDSSIRKDNVRRNTTARLEGKIRNTIKAAPETSVKAILPELTEFVPILENSRLGNQVVAAAILEAYPDMNYLSWLVDLVVSGSRLLEERAARALYQAVTSLDLIYAREIYERMFSAQGLKLGLRTDSQQRILADALNTLTQRVNVAPVRHRRAVLIGVDTTIQPRDFPRLPYAGHDIKALDAVLTKIGFEQSEILINEGATQEAIYSVLTEAANEAAPDDLIWVHYSGHGILLHIDGEDLPLLITFDTIPNRLATTGIPIVEFATIPRPVKEQSDASLFPWPFPRMLITLDAGLPPFIHAAAARLHDVAFLGAGRGEYQQRQLGQFTDALLDALSNPPTEISIADLANAVRTRFKVQPEPNSTLSEAVVSEGSIGSLKIITV